MKSVILTSFAMVLLVGLAPAALAQKEAKGGAAPAPAPAAAPAAGGEGGGAPSVQYKSKTVYDFDDDTVEGDLVRPDGEFVDSRRNAKHSSLIKIREDFIPEMLKSVEAI